MVGAVVHALRAERARFKHELDEYRKEASEALKAQRFSHTVEVERPELPEELQDILEDVVQESQSRRLSLKRNGPRQSAAASSESVWKDVSNVLDSSEKHLPVAEKYFKRVFDLIRDPDSLVEGDSIWREEDERVDTREREVVAVVERHLGESETGPSSASAQPSATSSAVGAEEGAEAVETFKPIVIDHTKAHESAKTDKGELLTKRSTSAPSVPSVQVGRDGEFPALAAATSQGSGNDPGDLGLLQQRKASGASTLSEDVPSTATEIRKKAQEFLVELDLLKQLGSNLQTKMQAPKSEDQPVFDQSKPPAPVTPAAPRPQYASIASSPIVVSTGGVNAGSISAADGLETSSEQTVSVQTSLEDVARVGDQAPSLGRGGTKDQDPQEPTRPAFFSEVYKPKIPLEEVAALRAMENAQGLGEGRSSFSLQQEREDKEIFQKLGIDSYDTASTVDRIVAASTLAPAEEIVEKLLGGEYDYKEKYLECAVIKQKLKRIRTRMDKPSGSLLDFGSNLDQVFHEGAHLVDAEASEHFITTTIDNLFPKDQDLGGGHLSQAGVDDLLVSDFFDIPKHLQKSASRNFFTADASRPPPRGTLPGAASERSEAGAPVPIVAAERSGPLKTALTEAGEEGKRAQERPSGFVGGTSARRSEAQAVKASASAFLMKLKQSGQPKPGQTSDQRPQPQVGVEPSRLVLKGPAELLREERESLREEQETRLAGPSGPASASEASAYDKTNYQSKKSRSLAEVAMAAEARQGLEERLKKLEEKVELNQSAMPSARTLPRNSQIDHSAVDSQVQTEISSLVEHSVQTSPIAQEKGLQSGEEEDGEFDNELVGSDEQKVAESEEGEDESSSSGGGGGGGGLSSDSSEEDRDDHEEEPQFEQVCDVGIEDVAPAEPEVRFLDQSFALTIEGENEDAPLTPDHPKMRRVQFQIKEEITLDNVVEEILGRILSEELEKELEKDNQNVSTDDVASILRGEVSRMYQSAQAEAAAQVEYSDEFNEMFLAHALLASLTEPPKADRAADAVQIDNLEFTDEPSKDKEVNRPPTPVRSAWEAEKGVGAVAATPPVSNLEQSANKSIRSVASAASTVYFDTEGGNFGDERLAGDGTDSTEDDTSLTFHSAGTSSTGTPGTPPTPASPRSFDDVISSVESKLRVFKTPQDDDQGAAGGERPKEEGRSASKVVRKLDLELENEDK